MWNQNTDEVTASGRFYTPLPSCGTKIRMRSQPQVGSIHPYTLMWNQNTDEVTALLMQYLIHIL